MVTPAQLQFFNNKTVETSAADRLKDMVAIAYDPVKKDVYVSDANQKVGSIFRIKTTGDDAYTSVEPIVASTYFNRVYYLIILILRKECVILLGDGGRTDRLRFTRVTFIGSVTFSKLVTVIGSLNVFNRLLPIINSDFE